MDNCIFCKIVARQVPAEIVYENDLVTVILDISPVNAGHTLVISNAHYADFVTAPEEIVREAASVSQKVAVAVMQSTEADGCNVDINNGSAAGQVVPHFHQHVVPRNAGDGLELWPGTPYPPGDIGKVAEKIRDAYRRAWL